MRSPLRRHRPTVHIDMELLHLAAELGVTQAMRLEIERQFREQHPDLDLDLRGNLCTFPYIENIAVNIPGYTVEYVHADRRTRIEGSK